MVGGEGGHPVRWSLTFREGAVPEQYEVYALRYATHEGRSRADSFLFDDDHAAMQPADYYL
jgi:hypothetical protein